jgi:hypothetical protein
VQIVLSDSAAVPYDVLMSSKHLVADMSSRREYAADSRGVSRSAADVHRELEAELDAQLSEGAGWADTRNLRIDENGVATVVSGSRAGTRFNVNGGSVRADLEMKRLELERISAGL